MRQALQESLTEDLFVPSPVFLGTPDEHVIIMMVHPKGIPQFFPPCDYVLVSRSEEENGFVPYQLLRGTIDALLEDYEFAGLRIKCLHQANKNEAAQLIQALTLEPVDLARYSQIPTDRFHDVPLTPTAN